MVDMDVVYDENGIPYIPAKRIKGCIREAALEMVEIGIIEKKQYERIFGKEGDSRAAFTLSNAYITGYSEAVEALQACSHRELVSQQNVLNQYTYMRTQTSVDLETGVADENSLRTLRVVKKGLVFEADCEVWDQTENLEVFEQAVSLVKHMGMSRTRGLGLVNLTLEKTSSTNIQHVKIKKEQLSEKNKIIYEIKLKSAMICKSAKGNQADTQDYIAGSKVLGLIAGALGSDMYKELMGQEDELIVSNAYILNHEQRCVPGRISLQKEKDQPYDKNGEMIVLDMLYEPDVSKKQMTPANIDYIDKNGVKTDVITEISYHHQRAKDKSIGRATGENDGSSFYQLCSISAGQSFGGYIYANKEQAERIIDAVNRLGNVRMGYGRSSEFGAVNFELNSVIPVEKKENIVHEVVLTLTADMILYNENGVLTTEIKELKKYLEEILDVSDIEIRNPFLQFVTVGGFNVTWGRRKPIFNALGKGTTMILSSKKGFNIEVLNHTFIGERVAEGYGEVIAEELGQTAEVCIKKTIARNEDLQLVCNDRVELIQKLLQTEFERRIQSSVREKLANNRQKYESKSDTLNSAVAKLRVIYKTENSYEAMLEQVAGIEAGEKNGLCKELTRLIKPEELKCEVTKAMESEYNMKFLNAWNEETLYKKVYRAYITELKQFVRNVGKKGDTK